MRILHCSFLLLSFLLLPTLSHSQWMQEPGPYGGSIYAVGVNPTATGGPVVFAGTLGGGNFRSTDNGATWTAASSGLSFIGTYAGCTSFAPKGTNIFGTTVSGTFLSTDNGTSWTSVNGSDAVTVYVNGNDIFVGTTNGALHSTGNGASWTKIDTGLGSVQVDAFVAHGAYLFAGTDGSGLYRSTNNGGHWYAADTGGLTGTTVRALAVSGSAVIAGTLEGIFRSTNDGSSWTMVSPNVTTSLVVTASAVLAGGFGVLASTDGGVSWAPSDSGIKQIFVGSLALNGTTIFAGTYSYYAGVYASTDNGLSWHESDHGVTGTEVHSLAVHDNGSGGYDLYAGTNGDGIYRSTDNGNNWIATNNGLSNAPINALAFSGNTLFAGGYQGARVSTNNGASWTMMNSGLPPSGTVKAFAVNGAKVLAATDQGVYLTTDGGSTWNPKDTGITNLNLYTIVYSGVNVYAGGAGLFVSTNDGSSWSSIGAGLAGQTVNSLAFIGTDIFAGTASNGVYRSTNNGGSWNPVNTGLTNTSMYCLATVDSSLIAGTVFGVFYSSNRGTNWTPVSTGMPTFFSVFWPSILALATVPNGSGGTDVLAGTFLLGVWRRPFSQLTSVESLPATIPAAYALDQNYPNPFNPSSTIMYELPTASRVSLKVYNMLGQELATLADGIEEPGFKSVRWNAASQASGVYFYRLEAAGVTGTGKRFVEMKKMILLK